MEEMREIVRNNLRGPPGMEEMREIVRNNLRGPPGMEEMREIVGNNLRGPPGMEEMQGLFPTISADLQGWRKCRDCREQSLPCAAEPLSFSEVPCLAFSDRINIKTRKPWARMPGVL
jgi:hypothetical protein